MKMTPFKAQRRAKQWNSTHRIGTAVRIISTGVTTKTAGPAFAHKARFLVMLEGVSGAVSLSKLEVINN